MVMISPECYYETLKGKSKEEIMTSIRSLKQEMGRLKNVLENPGEIIRAIMDPSEELRIHFYREFLEKAKQAYVEAGGTYVLSRSEEKADKFARNMDSISKITFIIGGYFGGYPSYIVDLTKGISARVESWNDEEQLVLLDKNNIPFTRSAFLDALNELHIGEWRRRYSTERFGYMILDGTQWNLEFEYTNGHRSVKFSGNNCYPYNFDLFKSLFGI